MSTIARHPELVRKAFMHLCDLVRDNPGRNIVGLLDETAMRFNLSPLDSEALHRMFSDGGKERFASAAEEPREP